MVERKLELKSKDSNMQPTLPKTSVLARTDREPAKIEDTVRTMAY